MTGPTSDSLAALAVAYVACLAGEQSSAPALTDLDRGEQQRARAIMAALHAAWRSAELEPPPLERHPLALTLGVVPDPAQPLSPRSLKAARQRAGLTVSALAAVLQARGWDTSTRDVAHWEQQSGAAAAVPPAVIKAIAEELQVDTSRLLGPPAPLPADIRAVTATQRFRDLAHRWATATGLGIDEERGAFALQRVMLATARRGDELGTDEWLAALDALVDAREQQNPHS